MRKALYGQSTCMESSTMQHSARWSWCCCSFRAWRWSRRCV